MSVGDTHCRTPSEIARSHGVQSAFRVYEEYRFRGVGLSYTTRCTRSPFRAVCSGYDNLAPDLFRGPVIFSRIRDKDFLLEF